MNHPCGRWMCPEYNQGQCFGGGCKQNPAPNMHDDVPSAEDGESESETTQED